MRAYEEKKHLPFGEVVTEKQFKWLNEIVFLAALKEVLQSGPLADRKAGEGLYPEQFELLNRIFGMSREEFDQRIESFKRHKKRKGELER